MDLIKLKNKINRYSFKELLVIFDMRYGIGKLEELLSCNWFNPFATFWLNIRCLSVKQAIHFPIWVYGRPRFYSLSGKIIIEKNLKTGMIKFNQVRSGSPCLQNLQSELGILGKIVFSGKCIIGTGSRIFVDWNATLWLGNNIKITDMVNIGCLKSITIGSMSRITHRCQIMDSNYHYIANFNKKIVPQQTKPIIIGNGCWIGNTTTITSGAKLPNYTIVGSNSLVNKSINEVPESSIVGGIPAKLISSGYRKIENLDLERTIREYYAKSPDITFEMPEDIDMEQCSKIR
ncbi:acyltransferase [Muribaculum intestinale]|uniref:acyltransferase n=1 Tax=Muribaculum intestinale TaxID=1796646 RepID=UPI0025AA0C8E|nr:acyltransferase [Muribaculum intestinale]